MDTLIYLVLTALFLAIPPTRPYGLIGLAVLYFFSPLLMTATLILTGIAYYFVLRRNKHGIRNIFDRGV